MDTQHMIDSLIKGNLIRILDAGTESSSNAFVIRDDKSPSGFRTIYEPLELDGHPAGKKVTPLDSTNGDRVLIEKRAIVAEYLIASFGLSGSEARRVAEEARFSLRP